MELATLLEGLDSNDKPISFSDTFFGVVTSIRMKVILKGLKDFWKVFDEFLKPFIVIQSGKPIEFVFSRKNGKRMVFLNGLSML